MRENRSDPSSRELELHIAVIPALRLSAAADPLFVISGGPGQSAGDLYLTLGGAFARVRRERDIVLLDQRGTGRSHRLDCELPGEGDFTIVDPKALRTTMDACLAALPGDPRYYTTSIAVQDLEEVRAALGYSAINIYGVSYGTRVAQHYMRKYPRRVRSVILDGIVPAQLALGPAVATDAQAALDAAFARCGQQQSCRARFPDLERAFAGLREQVSARPAVDYVDPLSARARSSTFGSAELSAVVRLLSYSDETVSLLPLMIHDAHERGDFDSLAAQYEMIKRNADAQIAYGMHFSVVCSEDAPRWAPDDTAALERTYMGPVFMQSMRAVCELWPRGPVDADFSQPLRSDIPTLLLSGSNDPVTPARYGEQVLPGLSRARHLVLEGQGHGQITIGCVPRLAADFIATADPAKLDARCIESVKPAAFLLSPTASAP